MQSGSLLDRERDRRLRAALLMLSVPARVRFPHHSRRSDMTSSFAKQLADIALEQHAKFQFMHETDPVFCAQIKKYWTETGHTFTSCSSEPWSAVFVSWCVKQAGATSSEFKFAAAHSVFVNDAINNPRAFEGFDIADHKVGIGDIIQNNRSGNTFDFAHAKANKNYISHSAIVVEIGTDSVGKFAFTVGGNEDDSIRRARVSLTSAGKVQQVGTRFISVLANRK
jgi:hypothetical protein